MWLLTNCLITYPTTLNIDIDNLCDPQKKNLNNLPSYYFKKQEPASTVTHLDWWFSKNQTTNPVAFNKTSGFLENLAKTQIQRFFNFENTRTRTACDLWNSNIQLTMVKDRRHKAGHAFSRQWHMRRAGRGGYLFLPGFSSLYDAIHGWKKTHNHNVLYYM
jgi:hypothetical protein